MSAALTYLWITSGNDLRPLAAIVLLAAIVVGVTAFLEIRDLLRERRIRSRGGR